MTGTKEALARLENRLLTKYEANLSFDQARYILGDLPKLSGAEIFLTLPADSCVRCETTATRRQNESPSSQEICRPIRYPSVHGRDKRQVRPTRKSEMLSDMVWPVSLNDGLTALSLRRSRQSERKYWWGCSPAKGGP